MRLIFIAAAIILFIIPGCSEKNDHKQAVIKNEVKKDSITITKAGEIGFRRSYTRFKKMSEKEEEQLYNANPNLMGGVDTALLGKFKKTGLVEGDFLVLKRLKTDTVSAFKIKASGRDEINVRIDYLMNSHFKFTLNSSNKTGTLNINTSNLGELNYIIKDIFPGGYPELIIFDERYIVNGNNYEFLIYEIT